MPGCETWDLVKVPFHGYLNRLQSSRRLEREAGRNVELMWLIGYEPDAGSDRDPDSFFVSKVSMIAGWRPLPPGASVLWASTSSTAQTGLN